MNLDKLYALLNRTTVLLRKGEAVTSEHVGMQAVTVRAMPHVSEAQPQADDAESLTIVDCELVSVGVDKPEADHSKDELLAILRTYPEPERLAGGPSYIEVGAVIGDQGAAFRLFALGQVLNLWTVITPARLGFTGAEATRMAGLGLVMISGFKEAT